MFGCLTVGLMAVALVMLVMGVAGAPGAVLYAKAQQSGARILGLGLAAVGQCFVIGAYAVFVVGLVRWYATIRPGATIWPLVDSGLLSQYGGSNLWHAQAPESPSAQHLTLGLVALAGFIVFLLAAFAPATLSPLYSWVPLSRLLAH